MKFGIFYELQLPRPWGPDSEYELYQNALAQLELADTLGYDYAWEVEHHFLEEYSHSSAPEVFLSGASQRTKRIRLGHGIFQLTTNHPAKVAEKVAALDLISNGRVELGMGESASITELAPFKVRFDEKRAIFEEAVRCLVPMFGDGGVEHHGHYFDFPLRNVLPKPRQKPHPPLWTACSQLPTIAYAGEKGIGALGFQFVSADAAHAWVHAYYNGMTKRLAKLADYPVNPNIALVSMFMCAPTDEEARAKADGATFFQFCLRYYNSADRSRPPPGAVNMWDEYETWKAANRDQAERALSGGLIGSPETIRRKLRKFEQSHIDQVILLNQAGRNSHQDICDSLELFAEEVMGEFHANIPAQEAWKADVLAGRTLLEEIDTQAFQDRFGAKALTV
ncbi:MAG TPA: LLM class flavin-dependent oxidoreductase [Caulobacteraceae bacterium]|jgi:alkanesulfonate monooxygenase SsuD/methylene tetrahydromethanopterin reductase-like flavin-dependent oxidoreductase (luciferase family)|nr:LLM class flavin-dependent oxidoreductase [Caulobacteraceae bacterium]